MIQVPPHFHTEDRISEKDLIPNDRVYSSLPETGVEGEWAVVDDAGTFKFYRWFRGDWRHLDGTSITFDSISPLTQKGDLLTRDATTHSRLPVGTDDQILIADSTADEGMRWGDLPDAPTLDDITPTTTKGDLIVDDGSVPDRLPVGNDGEVLMADSGEDLGVKWTSAPVPTAVACRIHLGSDMSLSNNSDTAVSFNTEDEDTDSLHSTVTNPTRITIPTDKDGFYFFSARVWWDTNTSGKRRLTLKRNGGAIMQSIVNPQSGSAWAQEIHTIFNFTAGDYVELFVYQDSGGTRTVVGGDSHVSTNLMCFKIGN